MGLLSAIMLIVTPGDGFGGLMIEVEGISKKFGNVADGAVFQEINLE